jgi:hypothetical protein
MTRRTSQINLAFTTHLSTFPISESEYKKFTNPGRPTFPKPASGCQSNPMLWFTPRGRTRNVIFLPYKKNLSSGLRQDPSFPKSDPAKPYPSVPVSSSLLSRNPPKNEVLPYKLIPSLKDTKSFTKKPLFLERLFEWEFW